MGPRTRAGSSNLAEAAEETRGIPAHDEARCRRLLVVDDDPGVRELLSEVLTGAGYQVETAFDSIDALDRLAAGRYDGLVLDLVLPEVDGLALYDRVLETTPSLKDRVVFISGEAREHQLHRVTRRTGAGVLRKPFNILDLMRILRERGL
jgi:CheY-like chemotaxis protein